MYCCCILCLVPFDGGYVYIPFGAHFGCICQDMEIYLFHCMPINWDMLQSSVGGIHQKILMTYTSNVGSKLNVSKA